MSELWIFLGGIVVGVFVYELGVYAGKRSVRTPLVRSVDDLE